MTPTLSRVCFLALLMVLTGCHSKESLEKAKEAAKRREGQKKLAEKGKEIWRESSSEKTAKIRNPPTDIMIAIDGQEVTFQDAVLLLGQPKNPSDPKDGQNPSEIKSRGTTPPSISIKNIPLATATNAEQIVGQNLTFNAENAANTEIILTDGSKFYLTEGLLDFLRADQEIINVSMEAKARKNSPDDPTPPVDVTGNFKIKVLHTGEAPVPSR